MSVASAFGFYLGDLLWMRGAECPDSDPEIFFPENGESAEPAKRICAKCPVKEPCLEYALENNLHYGVFGGMSENERNIIRRGRRRRRRLVA